VTWMASHKSGHYAAAGALVVLALFVVVCLVKALMPRRSKSSGTAAYATTGKRGR